MRAAVAPAGSRSGSRHRVGDAAVVEPGSSLLPACVLGGLSASPSVIPSLGLNSGADVRNPTVV